MSHDDDDFRPRRRRDDDDFDDRDRGGRRRFDDDDNYGRSRDGRNSREELARSKVAAPATILMVLGAIVTLWSTYSMVMYLVNPEQQIKQSYEVYRQFMEGFKKGQQQQQQNPKAVVPVKNAPLKQDAPNKKPEDGKEEAKKDDNKEIAKNEEGKKEVNKQDDPNAAPPPINPDIMTFEEFKKMMQGGALIGTIIPVLYGLVLLIGGYKMKQLSGYGFSIFTSIVAMLPCVTCCCLPTPFGLWALIVLMNQDVKDGFAGRRS